MEPVSKYGKGFLHWEPYSKTPLDIPILPGPERILEVSLRRWCTKPFIFTARRPRFEDKRLLVKERCLQRVLGTRVSKYKFTTASSQNM